MLEEIESILSCEKASWWELTRHSNDRYCLLFQPYGTQAEYYFGDSVGDVLKQLKEWANA